MTCIFGIGFVLFGHVAGNAVQFGVYMTNAIHPECTSSACQDSKWPENVAWALAVLTITALLNVATRRSAIYLNNVLAVIKVLFLVAVALMGIILGTMNGDGCRKISFEYNSPDETEGRFANVALALTFCLFPYGGYEQPFYVLSEIQKPKKTFARSAIYTMVSLLVMYPISNFGLLCATPYTGRENLPSDENLTLALFSRVTYLTGKEPTTLSRFMNIILAIFIFGNLLAQTYTGSRVKQEIAKEGILPFSLFFAESSSSIFSRLRSHSSSTVPTDPSVSTPTLSTVDHHDEQVPYGATLLHWASEIISVLCFVPATGDSRTSYRMLSYIHVYVVGILFAFLTAAGLLYLKIDSLLADRPIFGNFKGHQWRFKTAWKPWLDPLPTVLVTGALGFLLLAPFTQRPTALYGRTDASTDWIQLGVGISTLAVGFIWWLGIRFIEWKGRVRLVTNRLPFVEVDESGEAVQKAEVTEYRWVPDVESSGLRRRL
jgi:amino acid transporter